MWRISIHPEWVVAPAGGNPHPLPELLPLLTAIQSSGSIADAARATAMSYRRAWGMLRQFESEFGAPLGDQDAAARARACRRWRRSCSGPTDGLRRGYRPTLESLSSELEGELESLLGSGPGQFADPCVARLCGVAALVEALGTAARSGRAEVPYQHRGGGRAGSWRVRPGRLSRGRGVVPENIGRALSCVARPPRRHVLIHLAHRTQGLFVASGNPKRIGGLEDLARPDLRFVNRQVGSGTRVLIDLLLARHRIDPDRIVGYENTEFTHAAVAAYIASGMADVGFGLETAARTLRAGFHRAAARAGTSSGARRRRSPSRCLRNVVALLRGAELRAVINALPGYDDQLTGTVIELEQAFGAA